MAISRIDENGKTQPADILNIFTLDNTYGDMPDHCVQETIPHFMKAEKDCPDEAAPFVWVYPLREYTTALEEKELVRILSGDLFICRAITCGFPLSSVVSCDNFLKHGREVYGRSILVTPVPSAGSDFENAILQYVEEGGKVLFYGSLDGASDLFLRMFCVQKGGGCVGEIHLDNQYAPDYNRNGVNPDKMIIREDVCNGRLRLPLGAPILLGYDVEMKDGAALYRFPRFVHGECRVYVEQESGLVSVKERPPVSAKYRRRVQVTGLQNAIVRFFGESYCKDNVTVGVDILDNWCDCPGIFGKDFEGGLVKSQKYGTYYEVRNFTGSLVYSMPVENVIESKFEK